MKVAILTTETLHHAYFIKSLLEIGIDLRVFIETQPRCTPTFKSWHRYEDHRDIYESDLWFNSQESIKISNFTNPHSFISLNEQPAVKAISEYNADLGIVFGTSILKKKIIEAGPKHLLNLHGGDPQGYRGLDSHLWAIYHNDYKSIITTLHYIDHGLDTGPIVMQSQIQMNKDLRLHKLRSVNTELCLEMAKLAIHSLDKSRWLPSIAQHRKGRYYSSMPAELKDQCVIKLRNYVNSSENYA